MGTSCGADGEQTVPASTGQLAVRVFRSSIASGVSCLLLTTLALKLAPQLASAEVEPSVQGARSIGMGGTGVALIDSGAAVYHNPANLMEVDTAVVTLSFSPVFGSSTQPLQLNPADPASIQSFDTEASLAPFFLAAGGVRVHERVVVGLGAYIFGGTGGTIPAFPGLMGDDLELLVGFGEFHLPVAVQITDQLSVSAGLRLSFGFLNSALVTPTGFAKQEFTGFGFPGVSVALSYQPLPELRLGAQYRSAIRTSFSGDVTQMGTAVDGELDFDLPHQFKVGAALSLLERRLTLALDVRAALYAGTNDFYTSRVILGGTTVEAPVPLNWQNTYTVYLGAEYWLIPEFALRAGYAAGTSSVPNRSAAPFLPSPGLFQSFTLGAGTAVGPFEFDLAASYSFNGETVGSPTATGGAPGDYSQRIWTVGMSATYRHEG